MQRIDVFVPYVNNQNSADIIKQEILLASLSDSQNSSAEIGIRYHVLAEQGAKVFAPEAYNVLYMEPDTSIEIDTQGFLTFANCLKKIITAADSEYIAIMSPDVVVNSKVFTQVEVLLKQGLDAVGIYTYNSYHGCANRASKSWYDLKAFISAPTRYIDFFVCKKELLLQFNTAKLLVTMPAFEDAMLLNLLSLSINSKLVDAGPVVLRYDNQRYWLKSQFMTINDYNRAELKLINDATSQRDGEHPKLQSIRDDINNPVSIEDSLLKLGFPYVSPQDFYPIIPRSDFVSLPNEIWGITVYCNPTGDLVILNQYKQFASRVQNQGLKLLTVELSYDDSPFVIKNESCDILLQIASADRIWQRERLFNVAMEQLPVNCDKVVFLDPNIIFQNNNWVSSTAELLEQFMCVQPFSEVLYEPKNGSLSSLDQNTQNLNKAYSIPYALEQYGSKAANEPAYSGVAGHVLATRRELIQRHAYYDANIIGLADMLLFNAMYTQVELKVPAMNLAQNKHFSRWKRALQQEVNGSVFYANGTICSFTEGLNQSKNDALYLLYHTNFDPKKDISLSNNGAWQWNSTDSDLHKLVENYLYSKMIQ